MKKVGYKIRELRTRRRNTLKVLAKNTGLTTSFLSQVERSIASPSVDSLRKIANALNVKVGYFFEDEEQKAWVFVKKNKEYISKQKKIFSEKLAPGFFNIRMQPHIVTIGAKTEISGNSISQNEEKFVMVLKGKVELSCSAESLILEEGDSIYCTCDRELKKIFNIGKKEAKLLWITYMPI